MEELRRELKRELMKMLELEIWKNKKEEGLDWKRVSKKRRLNVKVVGVRLRMTASLVKGIRRIRCWTVSIVKNTAVLIPVVKIKRALKNLRVSLIFLIRKIAKTNLLPIFNKKGLKSL